MSTRRPARPVRETPRTWLSKAVTYVLLTLGAVVILGPFLWMVRSVITPNSVLYSRGGGGVIPRHFTLDHITGAFTEGIQPFDVYFVNSLIVTAIAVVSNVFFCGLAGFALARFEFVGRRALLIVIVLMLAIPIESRIIPLYILASRSGFSNTYFGIALPLLVTSLGIFLMRQYVMTIPREIDEAATVDGCSAWRLYWQIIFPICRPVIAAIAIFTFITAWNDFLWPLVITQTQDMQTLPVAAANLAVVKDQLRWGTLLAFSLLSVLPVLIFYLFMQRQFMAGITGGAVKE
ncbi:carbohydrate ABC transporter membrane protein 2, CUT1 family [Nocardioides sp. JS614]|nr:carbohydrate ABC transporter membrane protein 2, CUT1 family [Nocardioides sp. JS614]